MMVFREIVIRMMLVTREQVMMYQRTYLTLLTIVIKTLIVLVIFSMMIQSSVRSMVSVR